MKLLVIAGLLTAVFVFQGVRASEESVQPANMINGPQLIYPDEALMKGLSGWVVVRYDVTEQGDVENGEILSNCAWTQIGESNGRCKDKPNPIFDQAALTALTTMKYQPKRIDGAAARSAKKTRLTFRLPNDRQSRLRAVYLGAQLPTIERNVPAVKQQMFRSILKARELVDPALYQLSRKPNPQKAIEQLKKLQARELSATALAETWDALAHAYLKTNDRAAAKHAYREVLKLQPITVRRELSALKGLYQMEFADKEYQPVVDSIDRFLVVNGRLDPDAAFVKAAALYGMGSTSESLVNVLAAERVAEISGRSKRDDWLHLRFIIYSRMGDITSALVTMKELTQLAPSDEYAAMLSSLTNGGTVDIADLPVDITPEWSGSDYLPITKIQPIYPRRALSKGMVGWVIVEFTVTAQGMVKDPFVVENCAMVVNLRNPVACNDHPGSVFNNAALTAALKFKYFPKVIDGVPIDTAGVQNKITFELLDE
jgi:TonB family protein